MRGYLNNKHIDIVQALIVLITFHDKYLRYLKVLDIRAYLGTLRKVEYRMVVHLHYPRSWRTSLGARGCTSLDSWRSGFLAQTSRPLYI